MHVRQIVGALSIGSVLLRSEPLPGTLPLEGDGDRAAEMVAAIDHRLEGLRLQAVANRQGEWDRALAEPGTRARWSGEKVGRLRVMLGLVDERVKPSMHLAAPVEIGGGQGETGVIARGAHYTVRWVSWPVFRGVTGEGLWLEPDLAPQAAVVLAPDAAQTPAEVAGLGPAAAPAEAAAAILASRGVRVIVPCLVDRRPRFAGYSGREVLWRGAYEMGRTPLGYDVQRVLAAADWLVARGARRIGVAGYGEGGFIALCAAAVDSRFTATLCAGYFGSHDALADEPLDRNAFGYTREFGAAELAALIAPRALTVEYGRYPEATLTDEHGGAPGRLNRPGEADFQAEWGRAQKWRSGAGRAVTGGPETLWAGLPGFAEDLGLGGDGPAPAAPLPTGAQPDWTLVRDAQFAAELEDIQELWRRSQEVRGEYWKGADRKDAAAFAKSAEPYRTAFREKVLGVLPGPAAAPEVRTRSLGATNGVRRHEVWIGLEGGVFAYGILCVPESAAAGGGRLPAVVCQHGLEGRPADVSDPRVESPYYHQLGFRLAQRGYVTFAPQNPYVGHTRFRQVLHKAEPLGLTLWSFIARQHEAVTDWLASLPEVDPGRIAFYGLSYGGKTAMRIPAVVPRYCLSICSGDYNEWIEKCVTSRAGYSYLRTSEYDMPEWNLGNTYNYAEMSWLIFPRPFMVERGHDDGVAPDEWVAAEFARTRRQYDQLGMGDRTTIEFFNGPHTIHGVGTFAFLDHWLKGPPR